MISDCLPVSTSREIGLGKDGLRQHRAAREHGMSPHNACERTTQLRIGRPSSHDRVDIKPTPAHGRRETPSLLCLDRDSLADTTDSVGLNLDNR